MRSKCVPIDKSCIFSGNSRDCKVISRSNSPFNSIRKEQPVLVEDEDEDVELLCSIPITMTVAFCEDVLKGGT